MSDETTFETVQLTEDGGYIVNGELNVPANSGNRHFRAVQDWIKSGGVPAPFVAVALKYTDMRRSEYPDVGDQLDVLWKQFSHMKQQGVDLIQDADDTLDLILSIKARHPKTVA